jgi:hypothetical protein
MPTSITICRRCCDAEFAVLQHFSPKFALGVAGFHYWPITGDSGAGATLGDFKGRVTSIGPVTTYNFNLGKLPTARNGRGCMILT